MKQFELKIPTPCQQSWQQMMPDEGGRYCQQCSKTVVDFTALNQTQILQYFQEHKSAVCGRFQPEQLKVYSTQPNNIFSQTRLLLTTGLTFVSFLASAQTIEKAKPNLQNNIAQQFQQDKSEDQDSVKLQTEYKITGRVVDAADKSNPLPGVAVLIANTSLGTGTDANGYFELSLKEKPQQPIELNFRYVGYETITQTIEFAQTEVVDAGTIILRPDLTGLIGEVVIVNTNPISRLWWKIKGVCTKVF